MHLNLKKKLTLMAALPKKTNKQPEQIDYKAYTKIDLSRVQNKQKLISRKNNIFAVFELSL